MAYAGKAGRGNRPGKGMLEETIAGRDGRGGSRVNGRRQQRPDSPPMGRTGARTGAPAAPVRARVAPPPELPEAPLDWQRIAMFAGGVTLGLAFGAGAALLFAPRSGAATRHAIARRGRFMGDRAHDAWEDLRDDVRRASRRGRRRLRRRLRESWPIGRHEDDADC